MGKKGGVTKKKGDKEVCWGEWNGLTAGGDGDTPSQGWFFSIHRTGGRRV